MWVCAIQSIILHPSLYQCNNFAAFFSRHLNISLPDMKHLISSQVVLCHTNQHNKMVTRQRPNKIFSLNCLSSNKSKKSSLMFKAKSIISTINLENVVSKRICCNKRAIVDDLLLSASHKAHRLISLKSANTCRFCKALFFNEEFANRCKDSSLCCQRGKVNLEPYSVCPAELQHILTSTSTQGKHFRNNIRHYNAACAFASTVGKYEAMGAGPHVAKVNGVVRHIMPQVNVVLNILTMQKLNFK